MAGKRLVIPGFANKVAAFLPRIVPRAAVLSLIGGRQKRRQARTEQRDSSAPHHIAVPRLRYALWILVFAY